MKKRVSNQGRRRPGAPGGRRDSNRRAKMQALCESALQQFLERGLDAVSIEDIASAAGLAKGSFYSYFPDKSALVEELLGPPWQVLEGALIACATALGRARTPRATFEAYRPVGTALASLLLEHAELVRLYLHESRGPLRAARVPLVRCAERVSALAIDITRQAQARGGLRDIPPAVSALAVVGAVERLVLAVLRGEDIGPPLQVPEALTTLILDGLRRPEPRTVRGARPRREVSGRLRVS